MSNISMAYQLVINGDLPGGLNSLLKSISEGNPISVMPVWMQGDECSLRCYFRTPGAPGAASVSVELTEGFSMIVSGVLKDSPGDPLFLVSSWTKQGSTDVYYQGTINLNTVPLAAAFEANTDLDQLNVSVDIEVRNAGDTQRITYRADIAIARQAYSGEADPEAIDYPAAILVAPDGSRWRQGINNDGQPTFERVQ